MRYNSTYTVEDLIGTLSEMDPQAPVMVAVQPIWPFEHTITGVVIDCNGIVYLASKQHGYLRRLKMPSKTMVYHSRTYDFYLQI